MNKQKRNLMVIVIITILCISTGGIVDILSNIDKKPYDITTKTMILDTTTIETTTSSTNTQTTKKRITQVVKTSKKVNSNGSFKLTHYGPNCKGCSGTTASGYNVRNTIHYNDNQYGQLRVCATNKQFSLYSVIRIKNYKLGEITCIVLDRGVGSGVIDLLVSSEKVANQLGIQRVNIEVLRYGK